MKRVTVLLMVSVLVAFVGGTALANGNPETRGRGNGGYGRGQGPGNGNGANSGFEDRVADLALLKAEVEKLPKSALSDDEKAGLVWMREEEKLARDVYGFLYDKWKARPFANIGGSEQTHMDYTKLLLDRYGVADPVKNDARGAFSNPELAKLYTELTNRGSKSIVEAFKVAALIEELDIADVERWLTKADNADVRILYHNLDRGSRNHLRAFVRQLDREGASYEPEHISPVYFNRILKAEHETAGLITDPAFVF